MAYYATNAGPKQAQRLLFITISYFCEDFKNVNYEGNGNVLSENGAKPEVRYPLWRGRRFLCRTPKARSRPTKKYRFLLMKSSRHD